MRISDWSSDVCSTDLDLLTDAAILDRRAAVQPQVFRERDEQVEVRPATGAVGGDIALDHQRRHGDRETAAHRRPAMVVADLHRAEERRVGQECVSTCRYRWSALPYNKNKKKFKQNTINWDATYDTPILY